MDNIIWSERAIREITDDSYRPEILYGLCVSYFKKNEYKRSITVGENYLDNYPKKQFSDDIIYILGICWEQLDNPEKAISKYQELISQYPDSAYVNKAIERLEFLKTNKPVSNES